MFVPSMLDEKATQILARSLFKELRGSGYSANQILGLSTELIELVTRELRDGHAAPDAGARSQPVA
jgi:hypothetical protein